MDIEMSGLEELTQKLKEFTDGGKMVNSAVKEGGELLKKKLEEGVYSHGLNRRTGLSSTSIKIDSEIKNGEVQVGVSNQKSDAFYLYFHEFGTSKMRARPFFRPIFETQQTNIIQEMAKELRKEMGI